MLRHFVRAFLLGVLGVVVGCSITWGAVSTWTSLSSRWISAGFVLPALGLTSGLALADREPKFSRGWLRFWLALAAAPLCALGNYLSFVFTSRTWFGHKIAAEHQGFFYQLMHPDVLPTFFEKNIAGQPVSEQTWKQHVLIGLLAGPFALWLTTRRE